MKSNKRKAIAGVVAASLIAGVVSTAVLFNTLDAEAANTFMGIQTLIQQTKESGDPYTVLEIVPSRDSAEIGYLFSEYEPILSEWDPTEMRWIGWKEQLEKYSSFDERKAFIEGLKEELETQGFTDSNAPVIPVSAEYEEADVPTEGFTTLEFEGEEKRGYFELIPADGTATEKYHLQFAYQFSYQDVTVAQDGVVYYKISSETEITADNYAGLPAEQPIYVKAGEIYQCVGTKESLEGVAFQSILEEMEEEEEQEQEPDSEKTTSGGDSTTPDDSQQVLEGDNITLQSISDGDNGKGELNQQVSGGDSGNGELNQQVSGGDSGAGNLDQQQPGGNSDSNADSSEVVIDTYDDEEQKYYTLSFEKVGFKENCTEQINYYYVTPNGIRKGQNGEYSFVEVVDDLVDSQNYIFAGETLYIRNTFTNQEWFKKYVLNMTESEYAGFPVEVLSYTPEDLDKLLQEGTFPLFDFLYINSGKTGDKGYGVVLDDSSKTIDLSAGVIERLYRGIVEKTIPCVVDGTILFEEVEGSLTLTDDNTNIFKFCAMLCQESPTAYYNQNSANLKNIESIDMDALEEGLAFGGSNGNFAIEYVYCFFSKEAKDGLVNKTFSTPFYSGGDVIAEGFQTVLDEIKLENLYRASDSSNSYGQMSTEISQASVIRHVINYKYRRNVDTKKHIKVLEIQPAKTADGKPELTVDQIKTWAPDVESADITVMTTAEFIGKIEKLNETYDLIYIGTSLQHMNTSSALSTEYKYVEVKDDYIVNGDFSLCASDWPNLPNGWDVGYELASYSPVKTEVQNGNRVLVTYFNEGKYRFTLAQNVTALPEGTYKLSADVRLTSARDSSTTLSIFAGNQSKSIASSVTTTNKTVTLDFEITSRGASVDVGFSGAFASGKGVVIDNVKLKRTSGGKVDTTYYSDRGVGSTVFNDSSMNDLIYFHTGDLRGGGVQLSGMLDNEYLTINRNKYLSYYTTVRYSGNDITLEKMEALLSFLDGSYPIVVSDAFFEAPITVYENSNYSGWNVDFQEGYYEPKRLMQMGAGNQSISSIKVKDGYQVQVFSGNSSTATFTESVMNLSTRSWDDKISALQVSVANGNLASERRISTDHIDTSSYMYEFVNTALNRNYPNFYAWRDITDESELFEFYLNRPKVTMTGFLVNNEPNDSNSVHHIKSDARGSYNLEYKFTIQNEGAATADTRYQCKLYIDVNADGKYSEQEELGDIVLRNNGNVVSSDQLYAGREYVLTREAPEGYKSVLPWRVEISQVSNSNIYTSEIGYTKLDGMEPEKLKILQISRGRIDGNDWWGGDTEKLFNLENRIDTPGDMYNVLVKGGKYNGVTYEGISDDFDIDVTFTTVKEYEDTYRANPDYIEQFNMLILGFSDVYENISVGPLQSIIDFINSGKSVLFAHDTTYYLNHEAGTKSITNRNANSTYNSQNYYKNYEASCLGSEYHNSYTLSQGIRDLVGMDRYGALGNAGGKDVAYAAKSDRSSVVPQIHGYTYPIINCKDVDTNNSIKKSYSNNEVGSGGVTNTYSNLRYDTVYFSDSDVDSSSDNSKINSFTVENTIVTQVNRGQITDFPYKIDEDFEVANTHGQYYQLDLMADDDGDGQSDVVVWYCLGPRNAGNGTTQETIYSQSPNDVRNNYYIYNKGNLTYTGMGHSATRPNNTPFDESNCTINEAKLFINTMIASYYSGIRPPSIELLESADLDAPEMKVLYRYYDYYDNGDDDDIYNLSAEGRATENVYFTVKDTNIVKGTRDIKVKCSYKAGNTITEFSPAIYSAQTGAAADQNKLVSGELYYAQIPNDILKKCETGALELCFEVQSIIQKGNKTYETDIIPAYLDVLRVDLFDLH